MYFPEPATKISTILAVDDAPDNLLLVETILSEEGYQVNLAEDGYAALAQIEESPPDLVLLDVMMPGMDGYEVTKQIRENPNLPFIPILLITAYEQPSLVKGLDIGADDFIRKPVDVDELLARVRSLLRLKQSVDERERMAQVREDFVSRLTHDLRTPLVAADRVLELFQQGAFGELSPTGAEAIATMIRSNENLLQMVNVILEVHRYEAGSKDLIFEPFNIRRVIEEVVAELAPLAEEKGVTLKMDLGEIKGQAVGDRLEIRRLLTNLVGNALKFTDTGEINVRLGESQRKSKWIILEVEDTGAGISPEDLPHIFERFRHGKHKRADSGLGLYLCNTIVEAHKGKIEVQSELGKGALFRVYLPKK